MTRLLRSKNDVLLSRPPAGLMPLSLTGLLSIAVLTITSVSVAQTASPDTADEEPRLALGNRGGCAWRAEWTVGSARPRLLHLAVGGGCPPDASTSYIVEQLGRLSRVRGVTFCHLGRTPGELKKCLQQLVDVKGLQAIGLEHVCFDAGAYDELVALPGVLDLRIKGGPHFFDGPEVDDSAFSHLAELPRLRNLSLADTAVEGKGIQRLSALKELRALDLSRTFVDDKALAEVALLARLESLNLIGTDVSAAGIRELRKLPELTSLALSIMNQDVAVALNELPNHDALTLMIDGRDDVADAIGKVEGLRSLSLVGSWTGRTLDRLLRKLTELQELDVDGRSMVYGRPDKTLGDDVLKAVGRRGTLRRLSLAPVGDISPRGWLHLAALTGLEDVQLIGAWPLYGDDGTRTNAPRPDATTDMLRPFRTMTELRRLSLAGFVVSDEVWKELGELPALRQLVIENCNVSIHGLRHLASQLDELEVRRSAFGGFDCVGRVTPELVAGLNGQENLRILDVTDSGLVDVHVKQLLELLPQGAVIRFGSE